VQYGCAGHRHLTLSRLGILAGVMRALAGDEGSAARRALRVARRLPGAARGLGGRLLRIARDQ